MYFILITEEDPVYQLGNQAKDEALPTIGIS